MQGALRDSVKKWRLKPATSDGTPVQVEALLGFTFHSKVDSSKVLPELSDTEARKLATKVVEPVFPPGSAEKGTELIVRISVDETGKVAGIENIQNLNTPTFMAASGAVTKWLFRPYLKDGKPQYFHADIVFHVQ